ncbi:MULTISPECIES: TfoX/Sxy family DNA transformation protein [unclassified Arsenophonus]|uniref:TfoX/Sxy family DNA transformation protein n=1 Tax=unclassified Arsenophonus TaxID=2627083 RepID=UPI00285B6F5C|nr:TfoX/Sxy family DNA transformation protein [Arsenophonus sp.]MDR5609012.1 TfoX/Sxy family DNA transformation protein [Arsenophonus sp.]MDR5613367.1 TfoX/Sxy family DNA transformation protein [Arsenophonus sp.]
MLLFDSRFSCLQSLMENYGHIKKKPHFGGYCILVNHVIIGQVLDGEFYLRGCLFAELQFEVSGLQKLIYTKKGVPLILKYFFINEMLWNDNLLLCYYIDLAYKAAVEELSQKQHSHIRIKDLPNMNMSIERALGKVGINDVDYLKMLGAKVCYLKLRQKKVNLSIKLLFELAGAIEGYHIAVLPESIKIELITWYNSLT